MVDGRNPLSKLEREALQPGAEQWALVKSVPRLARLKQLQSLYLYRTRLTIDGVRRLQKALPKCRIYYRSATIPE